MWKKAGKIILYMCGILLFIVVLLYGMLQTGWVKKQVTVLAENLLSDDNQQWQIHGLEGHLPFEISLKEIRANDEQGDWLLIEQIHLAWNPLALLSDVVEIEKLTAETVALYRLPDDNTSGKDNATDHSSDALLTEQLAKIPGLVIGEVLLQEIILPPELLNNQATRWKMVIDGTVSATDNQIHANLETLEGIRTELQLKANLSSDMIVHILLHEQQGGIISQLTGLAETEKSLSGEIILNANDQQVEGNANISLGEQPLLALRLDTVEAYYQLQASGVIPELFVRQMKLPDSEWKLEARADESSERWTLSDIRLDYAGMLLSGNGIYNTAESRLDTLSLLLETDELAAWQQIIGLSLQGQAKIILQAMYQEDKENTELALQLQSSELMIDNVAISQSDLIVTLETMMDEWLQHGWAEAVYHMDASAVIDGNPYSVNADGALTDNREIIIEKARMNGYDQEISLDGRYGIADNTIILNAAAENIPLATLTNNQMQGQINTMLSAEGNFTRLPVSLSLNIEGLKGMPAPVNEWTGTQAQATATILYTPDSLNIEQMLLQSGDLALKAEGTMPLTGKADPSEISLLMTHKEYSPIQLDAAINPTTENIFIKDILLETGDFVIKGYTTIDRKSSLFTSELNIQGNSITAAMEWAGQKNTSGELQGNIRLEPVNGTQSLAADMKLTDVAMPASDITGEQLTLVLSSSDIAALTGINVNLAIENVAVATSAIRKARIDIKGNLDAGTGLQADTRMNAAISATPVLFRNKTLLKMAKENLELTIQELKGKAGLIRFALADKQADIAIDTGKGSIAVTPFSLIVDDGTVDISLLKDKGYVDVSVLTRQFPLQPLLARSGFPVPEMRADLALTVKGKAATPYVSFISDITSPDFAGNDMPLHLHHETVWDNTKNQPQVTTAVNTSINEKEILRADIKFPARFSAEPVMFELKENDNVSGVVVLDVALGLFNNFLAPLGHEINGLMQGGIQIAGFISNPDIVADISLKDGNYEHVITGACLRSITMDMHANNQRIELSSLTATGEKGKGSLNGKASYIMDTGALSANLSMKKLAAFCGGMIQGRVAGDIALNSLQDHMRAEGEVIFSPLSLMIPSMQTSEIPVVDYRYSYEIEQKEEQDIPSQYRPLKLDIRIGLPERVFVRGMGLDAEFAGALHIVNTARNPVINGKLNTVRGTLDVLGSQLAIEDGEIRFLNGNPAKPYLDVQAVVRALSTQIIVNITGLATEPELKLSSVPSLPQDELLALLIFGRPLQQITPLQAVQLAQAMAVLTGQSRGKGLLGTLREGLGVDTLSVNSDDEGGASVGAGKYITDKVFVGVEQGTTPENRRFTTEIELTPQLRATTATTQQGSPTVGLQWQKDY